MAVIPLSLLLTAWFSISCKTNLFCFVYLSHCVCSRDELYERWKLHFDGEVYIYYLVIYVGLPLLLKGFPYTLSMHIYITWKRLFWVPFCNSFGSWFCSRQPGLIQDWWVLYTVIGLQRPCNIIPEYELT